MLVDTHGVYAEWSMGSRAGIQIDILPLQSQKEESGHAGIPFTFHFVCILFCFYLGGWMS